MGMASPTCGKAFLSNAVSSITCLSVKVRVGIRVRVRVRVRVEIRV
jgi:hypothetical protein